MSILIARHALSEANNRNNLGTLAFAAAEAPLMEAGREQARAMGARFVTLGIDPAGTPVAVSSLERTQETAREAGFQQLTPYSCLNEVEHGMELTALRRSLDDGLLPPAAFKAAELILANQPTERVWFSHGLVIAGLCRLLGVFTSAPLIPKLCEIRELPL